MYIVIGGIEEYMLVKYLDPKTKLIGLKDNETGKIVLEAQYTQIGNSKDLNEPDLFVNGYAILHKSEKIMRNGKPTSKTFLGTVAPNGQILAPCNYAEISSDVQNGRVKFLKPVLVNKETLYLYGYFAIDSKNNKMPEVVKPIYTELSDFKDGYASGKTLEVEKVGNGPERERIVVHLMHGIGLNGNIVEKCLDKLNGGIDYYLEYYRKKWKKREDDIQRMIHDELKPIKEKYKKNIEEAKSDAKKLEIAKEYERKKAEIEEEIRKNYDTRKKLEAELGTLGI